MNILFASFLLTTLAGFSTMLGCLFLFIKSDSKKLLIRSLSFAAGVMLSVSFFDLIPSGYSNFIVHMSFEKSFLYLVIYFICGWGIAYFLDKYLPDNKQINYSNNKIYRTGIISMLAIVIHNIPEGIATFLASNSNISIGISLAIAIALHNIPEGIAISVPIYQATGSKKKACVFTFISSLAEPLGALIAFLFLRNIVTDTVLGVLYIIIAGIMSSISLTQLIPLAKSYNNEKETSIFFILGVVLILLNHFLIH